MKSFDRALVRPVACSWSPYHPNERSQPEPRCQGLRTPLGRAATAPSVGPAAHEVRVLRRWGAGSGSAAPTRAAVTTGSAPSTRETDLKSLREKSALGRPKVS